MVNWLTTRESLKAALTSVGADATGLQDRHIAGASKEIEQQLGRYFIPRTATRYYPWPQRRNQPQVLELSVDDSGEPYDLLAVTALTTDNGATTIPAADYFLEPANSPRKSSIEIDSGSATAASSEFTHDDTAQRAIAVTGRWGWSEDTETAGTVVSGLASDAAATTFICSNGALIDVGHTLLIEAEQAFVSERTFNDSGKNTAAALTIAKNDVTVVMEASHGILPGEVIQIDSEQMYIQSVTGVNLAVIRGYNGTVLATHANPSDVYVFRTLTIVRGVNGTTAVTHANTTPAAKYQVPEDVQSLCRAEAIFNYEQDKAGQSGQVGAGESSVNTGATIITSGRAALWRTCKANYREPVFA